MALGVCLEYRNPFWAGPFGVIHPIQCPARFPLSTVENIVDMGEHRPGQVGDAGQGVEEAATEELRNINRTNL